MKVHDVSSVVSDYKSNISTEKTDNAEKPLSFKRQLTYHNESAFNSKITELQARIEAQGKLVGERSDIRELQKYRELISEFMNEAVSGGYEFSKSGTLDSRGRHRMFAIIKRVNTVLENLTEEILSGQSEQISVLEKIDEIRGLLVDMFM